MIHFINDMELTSATGFKIEGRYERNVAVLVIRAPEKAELFSMDAMVEAMARALDDLEKARMEHALAQMQQKFRTFLDTSLLEHDPQFSSHEVLKKKRVHYWGQILQMSEKGLTRLRIEPYDITLFKSIIQETAKSIGCNIHLGMKLEGWSIPTKKKK